MSKKRKKKQKKLIKAARQARFERKETELEVEPVDNQVKHEKHVRKTETKEKVIAKKQVFKGKQKAAKKRTTPIQYFNEVKLELKKVSWPSKNEVVTATIIVIVVVIIFGVYTGILDFSFGRFILYISKLFGKGA